MNQFQNPKFESQNNPQVPPGEPMTPGVQQPTSMEEGNAEVLRVWDIQNQQATNESTTPERKETAPQSQAQPQVPPISEQPATSETDDPLEYIRGNTPRNPDTFTPSSPEISPDPAKSAEKEVTPQPPVTTSETEKEDSQEDLKKEIASVKELLSALLEERKVKDFTVYPRELLNPEITSYSGREMIKPFGIQTVRFGYEEFKNALDNAMVLDENTYILKYLSERPREDGSQPEPRLLKCTKEQVDTWKTEIERKEQQTQIAGQQYQQPPTAQSSESPPLQQF
jgi:hypothetical protein